MASYNELSSLVGKCSELNIVRRFGPLAAQVLFRMQAELSELEQDLEVLSEAEINQAEMREHAKSWKKANESIQNGSNSIRKNMVIEAEEKLGKYLLQLGSPDPCDVNFLRQWLRDEKCGNNFLKVSADAEATAWDDSHTHDLVTLNRRADRFAAWVANSITPLWHQQFGHRVQKKVDDSSLGILYSFDDKKVEILGNVLCTFLSTVIPSSSILVLYYVRSMLIRLLLIIAFSSVFSLIMGIVAQGKRYEIFAATIAFAAVQVVFVGNVVIA